MPISLSRGSNVTPMWHAMSGCLLVCFVLLAAVDTALAASCQRSAGAEAIPACEAALKRSPHDVELRSRYADILMDQRRHRDAVDVLQEALSLQPDNAQIRQQYRLASSLADEQASIEKLSVQTPAAGTDNRVNEILCKSVKGQRALEACEALLKDDPRNVTALVRRADELMAIDRIGAAVADYRRALKLDPGNKALADKLRAAQARLPAPSSPPTQTASSTPPVERTKGARHFSNNPLPSGATF